MIDGKIREDAVAFVLKLHHPKSGGFIFAPDNQPTLMATAYAVHTLEFLGALDRLNIGAREGIINFLMALQRNDGSFQDPQFDPSSIATTSHDEAYFDGEATCFAQNALDALGAPPPHLREFPTHLMTPEGLRAEFDSYDWRDPHLNSNRVMFWMAQLAHEADRHEREECHDLMDVGLDWMDANQSPRTGLWSGPVAVDLSPAMAATFHYTFFYSYRNRPLRHLERIIDSCLILQQSDGLFGRGMDVGQTCLDYDALDLLAKASLITDYRADDVQACFDVATTALLALGNSDGGYANLKERRCGNDRIPTPGLYHTGLQICSCDNLDSNVFSTWFRLIAVALCQQHSSASPEGFTPIGFRRLPWLGYHNIPAIRRAHEGREPPAKPLELQFNDTGWSATILPTGQRFEFTLPKAATHPVLKLRLDSGSEVDIRAAYKSPGQPYYSGTQALKQSTPSGEHNTYFLFQQDCPPEAKILLEICSEQGSANLKEVSVLNLLEVV